MRASSSGWRAVLMLGICGLASQACDVSVDAQGFTARDEKKFNVTGTPDLTLATFDGAIEVRAWDRPEVQVVIERRAETKQEADAIEVKVEQSGNQISIEARKPSGHGPRVVFGFHVGRSAAIIASVPRSTNLLARSGDGSIIAERIQGRVELRTGDGSVRGDDLKGQIRVHTGDGSVKLYGADGALDLDTNDGSITVNGKFTVLRARSGDGGVSVRADAGTAMTGDWDISTGDGTIDVELPQNFNADVDAHTGDGRIQVSNVPLTIVGDMGRSTVQGRLGAGGRRLKLRSGDGAIRLRAAAATGTLEPVER